jgi:hypothetical protein
VTNEEFEALDVQDIDFMTHFNLTDTQKGLLHLRVCTLSGVKDAQSLVKRAADFIHAACLAGRAVRYASLNRRYAHAARVHGIDIGTVAHDLIAQGYATTHTLRGSTLFASKRFVDEVTEARKGMHPKDAQNAWDMFWERAQ